MAQRICALLDEGNESPEERTLRERVDYFGDFYTRRNESNATFIPNEILRYAPLFDTVEKQPLTQEQRKACVVNEPRQRIIAGAGTGKTSTMVAKAAYLVSSGNAAPDEILALSYNDMAARELRERLAAAGYAAIESSTIHAYGLKSLAQARGYRPSMAKFARDAEMLNRTINGYIADLADDPVASDDLRSFLVSHPFPYRDQSDFKEPAQYRDFIRNIELRTLKGHEVKSFEELQIANQLFANNIEYDYERKYEIRLATLERRQYQPDFYLPEYEIYLEHFGVDREGRTAPNVDADEYALSMDWKRRVHEQYGTILVETYSWMRSEGVLDSSLRQILQERGVVFRPKPVNELLKTAGNSVVSVLGHLTQRMIGPLKESGRRASSLVPAKTDYDPVRTQLFLQLFSRLFARYQDDVIGKYDIDFSDMIVQAAAALRNAQIKPHLKYVLVDEFQDISPGRADFIETLVNNSGASLCVVGDDWQAIYAFSSSDGEMFRDFFRRYGIGESSSLSQTFRFNNPILQASSKFVQKNPGQIPKQLWTLQPPCAPEIVLMQVRSRNATSAAVEWLSENSNRGGSVKVLARTNSVLEQAQILIPSIPGFSISFATAHAAKGTEADYVVILNASGHIDGFPSLRVSDPILSAVLPPADDFPFAEERRLFYVALTRARSRLIICYDPDRPSVFVKELLERPGIVTVIIDGNDPDTTPVVVCRSCREGHYVARKNKTSSALFFGCSKFWCLETASPCPTCKTGILDRIDGQWKCTNTKCAFSERACPTCKRGRVKVINGKYGTFESCSYQDRNNPLGCPYKQRLGSTGTAVAQAVDSKPRSLRTGESLTREITTPLPQRKWPSGFCRACSGPTEPATLRQLCEKCRGKACPNCGQRLTGKCPDCNPPLQRSRL